MRIRGGSSTIYEKDWVPYPITSDISIYENGFFPDTVLEQSQKRREEKGMTFEDWANKHFRGWLRDEDKLNPSTEFDVYQIWMDARQGL